MLLTHLMTVSPVQPQEPPCTIRSKSYLSLIFMLFTQIPKERELRIHSISFTEGHDPSFPHILTIPTRASRGGPKSISGSCGCSGEDGTQCTAPRGGAAVPVPGLSCPVSPCHSHLGQQWSPWSGGSGRSWRRTWGGGGRQRTA